MTHLKMTHLKSLFLLAAFSMAAPLAVAQITPDQAPDQLQDEVITSQDEMAAEEATPIENQSDDPTVFENFIREGLTEPDTDISTESDPDMEMSGDETSEMLSEDEMSEADTDSETDTDLSEEDGLSCPEGWVLTEDGSCE